MILVILAVSLIVLIVSYTVYQYSQRDSIIKRVADVTHMASMVSSIFFAIILIGLLVGLCAVSTTDDKLAMYEEENAKIEVQIADIITQYQQYEQDTFSEVSAESSMTLISLYPELKSDALVQKQIDMYIENNARIKQLKEDLINLDLLRFMIYFGGI